MSFEITITDAEIELVDSNPPNEKRFLFNLSSTVNMTELIHYISDRENKIECQPVSWEEFKTTNEDKSPESLKLVEYIFKVINAFNESYSEVFEEKIIA